MRLHDLGTDICTHAQDSRTELHHAKIRYRGRIKVKLPRKDTEMRDNFSYYLGGETPGSTEVQPLLECGCTSRHASTHGPNRAAEARSIATRLRTLWPAHERGGRNQGRPATTCPAQPASASQRSSEMSSSHRPVVFDVVGDARHGTWSQRR